MAVSFKYLRCNRSTRPDNPAINRVSAGTVPACCLDHAAVHEFGNVGKQSMLEIFNGPLAAKFRSVHLKRARRNLAMCATCNVGEFWADRSKPGQAERETRFIAAERQVEVSGRTGRMIR